MAKSLQFLLVKSLQLSNCSPNAATLQNYEKLLFKEGYGYHKSFHNCIKLYCNLQDIGKIAQQLVALLLLASQHSSFFLFFANYLLKTHEIANYE